MKTSTTSAKVTMQQGADETDCTGCKFAVLDAIELRQQTLQAVHLIIEFSAGISNEDGDLMVGG